MIIPEDNFAYGFVFNLYSGSKFKFLVNIENSFSLSYVFILLISFGIIFKELKREDLKLKSYTESVKKEFTS